MTNAFFLMINEHLIHINLMCAHVNLAFAK